jgi:hypothetical protein
MVAYGIRQLARANGSVWAGTRPMPGTTRSAGRDRPAQAVLPETGSSSAVASMSLTSSRSTL